MSAFERDMLAAQDAERTEKSLRVFDGWLARHPEIRDCIANRKAFREYADFSAGLTSGDFDFAYSRLNRSKGGLVMETAKPEEVKQELIETILQRLTSKNGGRDGLYNEFNLKSERIRISQWSLSQLTDRLNDIVRKQSLNSMTTSELKQIVADAHQDHRKFPGFPDLDPSIGVAEIKAMSSEQLKKLVRLHSAEQVNARLAGRG
jgi:hypothetical protein